MNRRDDHPYWSSDTIWSSPSQGRTRPALLGLQSNHRSSQGAGAPHIISPRTLCSSLHSPRPSSITTSSSLFPLPIYPLLSSHSSLLLSSPLTPLFSYPSLLSPLTSCYLLSPLLSSVFSPISSQSLLSPLTSLTSSPHNLCCLFFLSSPLLPQGT